MNRHLRVLLLLRKVLMEVGSGRGVAGALVTVFRRTESGLNGVARATLLGYPPAESMRLLVHDEGPEVGMLASLVVNGARGDAKLVGRRGERLSLTLESWIKGREARRMEQKVIRFRGLIVSGVLGAVLGMLSSVGPLVGGLSFTTPLPPTDPIFVEAAAAAMACMSSAMLGLFMSGRGFLVNVASTLAVFALVTVAVSPLTSISPQNLWGIK
jgi:hypothetical protein